METIQLSKQLEPYFLIAENVALKSPCTRRQYGTVIVEAGPWIHHWTGYNQRVSNCCNGTCARDKFNTQHGQRTEVGAEIHAETAALINAGISEGFSRHLVLVGFQGASNQLKGTDVYPCHACILAIKYAGYRYIYIKNWNNEIVPVSVSEILQFREREWEYDG